MRPDLSSDALPLPPADYEIRPAATPASRLPLIALIVMVACLTVAALYFVLRNAERHAAAQAAPAPVEHAQTQGQAPDIQGMVDKLAARLAKEPQNGPGWQMLARSYAALGRFGDAAAAYSKAAALLPPSADLLADQADVLAMSQQGNFAGEPLRLLHKALEIDPKHPKALALAGTEAFKRSDYREALRNWEKSIDGMPADSEFAASVRSGIADAKTRLGTAS